jgi:hypothetical protein
MVEQVIVFPAHHKREPSHIGEHRPIAILSIQPQERVQSVEVIRRQIPANDG